MNDSDQLVLIATFLAGLQFGTEITLRKLAWKAGLSGSRTRQALRELAAVGLVKRRKNKYSRGRQSSHLYLLRHNRVRRIFEALALTCPPNPELLMSDEDFDRAVL